MPLRTQMVGLVEADGADARLLYGRKDIEVREVLGFCGRTVGLVLRRLSADSPRPSCVECLAGR